MWRHRVGILCSALPHGVVVLDGEFRVVVANRAASVLFHTAPERLRGAPITTVVPQTNVGGLLHDFRDAPRVIEVRLSADGTGDAGATVRITAVQLGQWDAVTDRRRTRRPSQDNFTLLVVEDISDRALLEQQLVDTEKQIAMGQLAAGILHEVSNPLVSIASNLLFIRGAMANAASSDVVQALDVSLEQVGLMRELLGTLSNFPTRPAPRYEVTDLHEVIRRCLTLIANEAAHRSIQVGSTCAPTVMLCEMDVRLVKQVLINVLKNAMEAMPHGGRLDVRTRHRAEHDGEPAMAVVDIADTGNGIAESDLRKVFRPLFSTKPRGAGLGLSFCRQTVEEHGGQIRLVSRGEGQGTVATISLPVRQTTGGPHDTFETHSDY